MSIKTICVCGAGTMGRGIAQVCAQSGFNTILYELNTVVLKHASDALQKQLAVLAEKGKIGKGKDAEILKRIHFTSDISDCHADLVIEAIIENADAKRDLFKALSGVNGEESIFATNTSSLPVNVIANAHTDPSRVIGLHFFNPAPVMKLVEVVTTASTDEGVLQIVLNLVKELGKTAVVCSDSPGFIVNRVARPYYIESLRLVEDGVIDPATADSILEATGFKMGPFRLMDLIGNDVNFAVSNSVYEQLNRPARLKPSYIQQEKVDSGELGKKTGKGYYSY